MLKGKKVLIGVTASIAAYKAILLTRLLVKEGAEVKIIVTPDAKDFVSTLTLSTLSKNEVLVDLFDEDTWANHVMLGRWADVFVIAPLTCNTLAKMATGLCDNLLMATYLSAICPVVVAPAMDEDMWHHHTTKANLQKLSNNGVKIIPVSKGELASGLIGDGRMEEPEGIIQFLKDNFFLSKKLAGFNALVTAGPTYEHIDPIRFIGNHSSGKMGVEIARTLSRNGANVTLVLGPVSDEFDLNGINSIRVSSASEMFDECMKVYGKSDITIMAAAIADYAPVSFSESKIKKNKDEVNIELVKTVDILNTMGER